MLGLRKDLRLCNFVFVFCIATVAHAFVPQPGQIFRFQPNVLKSEKPFTSKGTLTIAGTPLPYTLKWFGPDGTIISEVKSAAEWETLIP